MAVKLRPGCRSSKGRHTKRTPTLVVRELPTSPATGPEGQADGG
jgi:hypothetical protein